MANGKQIGEQNVLAFAAWAASKTDEEFQKIAIRGVLSRREIANECGFAKSALDQNPRVKAALRALEDGLRLRRVLRSELDDVAASPNSPSFPQPVHVNPAADSNRLRRFEVENASLRAEIAELKRQVQRFTVLQDALALTGRLPR